MTEPAALGRAAVRQFERCADVVAEPFEAGDVRLDVVLGPLRFEPCEGAF